MDANSFYLARFDFLHLQDACWFCLPREPSKPMSAINKLALNSQKAIFYQKKKFLIIISQLAQHMESMLILCRQVRDQTLKNFHVIFTYLFDVILLIKKSTSFPPAFFNVVSMFEKSTLLLPTYLDVISIAEISTLFSLTFFHVNRMVEKSSLFSCKFWWAKTWRRFCLSCKLIKTFEKVLLC